ELPQEQHLRAGHASMGCVDGHRFNDVVDPEPRRLNIYGWRCEVGGGKEDSAVEERKKAEDSLVRLIDKMEKHNRRRRASAPPLRLFYQISRVTNHGGQVRTETAPGIFPGDFRQERAATETKARKKRGRRSLPVVVIHHDARPDPPDHQLRPPRVDERPVVSTSFGARSCVYQWTSLAARSGVVVGVEEGDDPDALGPAGRRRAGMSVSPAPNDSAALSFHSRPAAAGAGFVSVAVSVAVWNDLSLASCCIYPISCVVGKGAALHYVAPALAARSPQDPAKQGIRSSSKHSPQTRPCQRKDRGEAARSWADPYASTCIKLQAHLIPSISLEYDIGRNKSATFVLGVDSSRASHHAHNPHDKPHEKSGMQ
ncbi:hypothetical protein THAOC_19877, partial [Thalassiosira oceanica]